MKSNERHEWSLAQWEPPSAPDRFSPELQEGSVQFLANQEDFECCLLADLAMGVKAISSFTRLSTGQISYRLKKAGIKIKDYREGRGKYAAMVFNFLSRRAATALTAELRVKELTNGT